MFKTIIALLLILPSSLYAGQIVPKWSLEKQILAKENSKSERLFGLEYIMPLKESMKFKAELGGWAAAPIEGRKSSFYGSFSWGYRVEPGLGMFGEAYIGPTLISHTDSVLGSKFQISHDVAVGWIDVKGYGLSLGYKHISNAGLAQPNRGRDFLGMRFIIPIN